ncbi:MAG: phosphatase PAP2 family protein [Nitrospinota bacterium]|nr:phosphatase PAP2 family protein [Nitrospinota bacterium]
MTQLNDALFLWINHRFASPLMDGFMTFITVTGDSAVVLSFGLLALALWSRTPRRAAMLFLAAMALGGGIMHGVKQSLPKDRPLAHFEERIAKGELTVRTPYMELYHRTFPSGHTQSAFTAAVFLALAFRGFYPAAALITWAALVGFSRIYIGVHFPMDVAAGALLGGLCGWLVYRIGFGGAAVSPGLPDETAPTPASGQGITS